MNEHRSEIQIIYDILLFCRNGALKTHIVYKCNLNFKIIAKYLEKLIEKGLLSLMGDNKYYTESPKGFQFIVSFENMMSIIGEDIIE
jgi:predicted transcriptional regulator